MKIDFKNFKFKGTPLHSLTAVVAALVLSVLLIMGTYALCSLPSGGDKDFASSGSDAALRAEMDKVSSELSSQNGEVAE